MITAALFGASLAVFSILTETDRLAQQDLWPGFDPARIPAAVHDGEQTYLFRHPSPPEGFEPLPGRPDVSVFPGRHPAVVANTSVMLAGVRTATLMASQGDVPLSRRAAVLLHEMFHVHQRDQHPAWSANEAELFMYPLYDAELLSMRRLETEAFRRALATHDATSACWSRRAMTLRGARFARMSDGAVGYERGNELNEGLATYVEHRALRTTDAEVFPSAPFAADAIRHRAYRTGVALGRLLDRHAPAWRETLSANDTLALDSLLASVLGDADEHDCAFPDEALRDASVQAAADVAALHEARVTAREAFMDAEGWRLVIVAGPSPLALQGFDPLNVMRLGDTEVLHTRFLRLGVGDAALEVIGRSSLTIAAGTHPLFNGVRQVVISGLAEAPVIAETDGVLQIRAEGLKLSLVRHSAKRDGRIITVTLE